MSSPVVSPPAKPLFDDEPKPSRTETRPTGQSWSVPAEPDWDREIGWERPQEPRLDSEPEPEFEAESQKEPLGDILEAETGFGVDPFDPDLPPSRTQRSRPPSRRSSGPRGADPAPSERGGRRSSPPVPAEPEDPLLAHEPAREIDVDPFAAREAARRPRGRSAPGGRVRPVPGERDEPSAAGPPLLPAPSFADEPPLEEPPRRRGGRAAIRSRGGDWEQRPREVAPPTPDPDAERLLRGHVGPRDYEAEREVRPPAGRASDSGRRRGAEPSDSGRDRERQRPHDRAGEPGYVPRRERLRSGEPGFGGDLFPADSDWPEHDVEPAIEREFDLDAPDFAEGDELGSGDPGSALDPNKADGRRRRRRRGRRRDRPRDDAKLTPSSVEPDSEHDPEFDDFPAELQGPSGYGRGLEPDLDAVDDLDDLDLDDIGSGDHDSLDDDFVDDLPATRGPVVEEEIDHELEQEIRKEIEEIEELEREMGLRGTSEARPKRGEDAARTARGVRGRGPAKPPIQEIFRRGDEVLVQVIKESIGTKGPTLSTYISIPGRYLVLMPGLNRVGVSRKIVDEGQRRKLREIMHELNPPKGLGFIVRTAGLERTKRELARDLAYLLRLWKVILRRIKKSRAPTPIYQESDMIIRTIRDIFTSEIDTIWIDEPSAFERAQDFLKVVMPRFVNRLKLYDEKVPLFHKYGIEEEISKIQRRHVPLPEGGSIVIDPTEALVAIDVNSGNFRVEDDAERTAYEMNLRAAREIARQLRLRDLGGVIVNDFIDMREERHRRGVERALREAIKRDRARTKVLRMSAFGLIEMTRQRIRPSLKRSIYEDCTHCGGAGVAKTAESMAIDVMRLLALASHRGDVRRINVSVSAAVATYLTNKKRREIASLELEGNLQIFIAFKEGAPAEHLQIDGADSTGSETRLYPLPTPGGHRRGH
jgi:ribonuclease E